MRIELRLVLIAFVLEGVLAGLSVLYFIWRDTFYVGVPTVSEIALGIITSIPLLLLSWSLFRPSVLEKKSFRQFREFKQEVVMPLVAKLGVGSSAIISVLAGVCEELFFRGVLQVECGIFIASALFSLLHFGSAVKKYYLVAIIYFLVACYLGILYQQFENLWVPIIAHGFYDFIALLCLLRERKTESGLSASLLFGFKACSSSW